MGQFSTYRDTMDYMRQELVLEVDLMRRLDEKLTNLKQLYRADSNQRNVRQGSVMR